MKQCEFCGTNLPTDASFCGICGHVSNQASAQNTYIGDIPTLHIEGNPGENDPTLLVERLANNPPTGPLRPVTLVPIEDEDEKERRRRAAVLGLGLPLLANQQMPGQIPTIQGAPQIAHIPVIHGAPGAPSMPGGAAPSLPGQAYQPLTLPGPHGSVPHGPMPHPPKPKPPAGSTGGLSGCLTIGAILVAATLIILISIIGLSLTVWTPNLTLSGNSTVAPGGTIALHGNNFLPNSTVTLTLDNGIPLLFSQRVAPTQLAGSSPRHAGSAVFVAQAVLSPRSTNAVTVRGDGSFAISLHINPAWTPGQHSIHATESVSHRNASLVFTISQPGVTVTPGLTPGQTDTPQPSPTPSPTPTPAPAAPPTLSCATPGSLTLGPISELSSQVATGGVTLCTNGSGQLTWNASWDQNQAPWLQLNQSNGTIQAPNQATVSVSAAAANLPAGTYTTALTFTDQNNTTQVVNVTFKVQTGCVNATPPRMIFTGVEGNSDPASTQSISVTNCGLISNWSASISNNSSWLSINPNKGTLKGGATGTITVAASNLKAGLKAGSYIDTIVIKIGSQTTSVTVALTVQAAPLMQLSTNSLTFNLSCSAQQQSITVTNGGGGTLTWTAGTPSQSWLTVVSATGNTPGTLTLQANRVSNGSYTATVTIKGSDGETQTVTVTLNVTCIT